MYNMIKIRKAKIGDVRAIHTILNRTKELRGIDQGEEYPMDWIKGTIKDKNNFMVYVIGEKDKMYGFIIIRTTQSVREAILVDVYIIPSQRKNGLATMLIKRFEDILIKKGYNWFAGFIELENKNSQKLFNKLGYDKGNAFYLYRKVIN